MILPITLTMAGLAAIVNIWLAIRCGQVRSKEKISVGDGGNDLMIRRMRAHSNFAEFTPIVLILVALVELAWGTSTWLWVVAMAYIVGRVAHGLGMDNDNKGRGAGIMITMLATIGLGLCAIAIPHLSDGKVESGVVETLPAAG
jgi:uncharacterized protein